MKIVRTDEEIENVLDGAMETLDDSRFFAATYEQGVYAVIRWLTGQTDEHPLEQ